MDRLLIRHRLLDKGMSLVELSRLTGLAYDRVIRLINGYRRPKAEEAEAIAEALELPLEIVSDQAHQPMSRA